jgi:hypothetical protein
MQHTALVAIDPGPHTGLAVFVDGKLAYSMTIAVTQGQDPAHQFLQVHAIVNDLLFHTDADVEVVVEDFKTTRPQGWPTYHTIQLIGWVRGVCFLLHVPCTPRLPAMRKAFLEEAQYLAKIPHEQDAIAHGLAWLARKERQRL